jgi:hypothetical protein
MRSSVVEKGSARTPVAGWGKARGGDGGSHVLNGGGGRGTTLSCRCRRPCGMSSELTL